MGSEPKDLSSFSEVRASLTRASCRSAVMAIYVLQMLFSAFGSQVCKGGGQNLQGGNRHYRDWRAGPCIRIIYLIILSEIKESALLTWVRESLAFYVISLRTLYYVDAQISLRLKTTYFILRRCTDFFAIQNYVLYIM